MSLHSPERVAEAFASALRLGETGTPLQGRSAEVDLALSAISEGRGAFIWLAEPGMGKSATLEQILGKISALRANHEVLVVRVQAPARGVGDQRDGEGVRSLLAQIRHLTGVELDPRLQRSLAVDDDSYGYLPEVAAAGLGEYLARAVPRATTVLVADDIDLMDNFTRAVITSVVVQRRSRAVLLGTATDPDLVATLPYPVERRVVQPLTALDALRLIKQERRLPVSPAVASRLTHQLGGNPGAIAQIAYELTPAQLAGWSVLPDPLPTVRATKAIFEQAVTDLSERERFALLVASVSVVDRIDILLDSANLKIDDLVDGQLSNYLSLISGHFRFADPRVRSMVHETATLSERTAAHQALAQSHSDIGEKDISYWHRALATLAGDSTLAKPLLELAMKLLRRGGATWALEVAREAASHTQGEDQVAAQYLAGRAALEAGFVQDAADFLRQADRRADEVTSARLLAPLVHALTLSTGQIPQDVLDRRHEILARVKVADVPDQPDAAKTVRAVARALFISACLHGQQGQGDEADKLLEEAHQILAKYGLSTTQEFELLESWACVFIPGREAKDVVLQSGAHSANMEGYSRVIRGIRDALNQDFEQAQGTLTTALAELAPVPTRSKWFDGEERAVTPIVEAHLRLALVFVHLWSGNIARAASELSSAALRLPIGLPMAGISTVVARRLDVLISGELGPLAAALEETGTAPSALPARMGLLIDRAVSSALEGHYTEAATLLELANERERSGSARILPVPGVDLVETWVLAGRPDEAERAVQVLRDRAEQYPVIKKGAALLRAELCVAGPEEFPKVLSEITAVSRTLYSPFERGRTELTIGRCLAAHGDMLGARDHLLRAVELFSSAGAAACTLMAQSDLADLAAERQDKDEQVEGEYLLEFGGLDLREEWGDVLTDRELDVALLVVEGSSNRDVAEKLFLSVRTVEVHLGRVFRKLGVRSRVELAVLAHRMRG